MMRVWTIGVLCLTAWPCAAGQGWTEWPPRDYLVKSLAEGIQPLLDAFHPETGRFGTEPWICNDQNRLFALAAAWAIEDPANPWHHDPKVLEAIAKGGEALVDAMDEDGKWIFRKKDNSTWGPIHMPWTYSRWIRAYALAGDALPEASREKWEKGLLLGFSGIRRYMDGNVHNIPTHHAMALYIAGQCFEKPDWCDAATGLIHRAVDEQDPAGFWTEHFGPVVGYNRVYVDALGVFYHFSHDPVVLKALGRAAQFHASVLWPDGSAVSCIDERQLYHRGVDVGNVGFSWTPTGRGFLLEQAGRYAEGGEQLASAEYAASMLLYGGSGSGIPPTTAQAESAVFLGDHDALIRRAQPWAWACSAYACTPIDSRWIQDRQNHVDVYHDALGVVAGGGNTKLQPYWSTFTVGDPALLKHTPGDESPDFTPPIALQWTAEKANVADTPEASTLELDYDGIVGKVRLSPMPEGELALTYTAPPGKNVEAHLPLMKRGDAFTTASGKTMELTEEVLELSAEEAGGAITCANLSVALPPGSRLRWPARPHNPYKKDGSSALDTAKLVVIMPFEKEDEHRVVLKHVAP